jgi:hypothetical protein
VIPNDYHFVWFGPNFPFANALAIRSLAQTTRPRVINLHLSHEIEGQPHYDALLRDVAVNVRRIDFDGLVAGMDGVDRAGLRAAYGALASENRFAALSDVMRYALLWREGGCYLDLDTITVRDLRPLLTNPGFCGRELILVPARAARRRRILSRLRTGPLTLARYVCAHTRQGVRWFKRIARLFSSSVNGAVLGLPAGHVLAHQALQHIPRLWPTVARRRPAIGPDLLQDLLDDPRIAAEVAVFEPRYFYPLGPTMAAHFFRDHPDVARLEREVVSEDTYVVHWYNDRMTSRAQLVDPDSVRANAGRQLFSRIAARFLPS